MFEKEQQLRMLREMMLIREFENAVSEYKDKKLIYGGVHCCNGEEAVAVGVCSSLKTDDYIVSTHRPHGHAIAKGVSPESIMAEIFGKTGGLNSGKGGSMHLRDSRVGMIASSGIVGSGIPLGCGAAFAAKHDRNGNRIACVFFGDGSANEGIMHECLNLASTWDLPLLFVLEDNELAVTTNTRETSACNDYVTLSKAYGIDGCHVDGQDVEKVFACSSDAVQYVRNDSRPFFIQAHTIRFNEHAEGDYYRRMIPKNYRDYIKLENDRIERCPIERYKQELLRSGIVAEDDLTVIESEVRKEIAECIDFAMLSPEPESRQALEGVFNEV